MEDEAGAVGVSLMAGCQLHWRPTLRRTYVDCLACFCWSSQSCTKLQDANLIIRRKIHLRRTLALIITICGLSMVLPLTPASAQKKFSHAVERSEHAGRIVASLALLPDTGFPQELIGKAEAVAVFPRIKRQTAFFMQVTQGYGVICLRTEKGWTLPAFYQFSGGRFGSPFADSETFSIILLFMTKDAVIAFEKAGCL